MKFKSLKTLALATTAILGMVFVPICGNAANNADVVVDIETLSGITALNTADMNFGSWIVGIAAADTATIAMAAATGTYTANEGANSDLVELTADATGVPGTILVTLPAGADGITLQMTRGAITQFGDAGLSLGTITYINSDDVLQTGTLAAATPVPITVDVGATGATVSFGATITATATPANSLAHTASFNVAFAY